MNFDHEKIRHGESKDNEYFSHICKIVLRVLKSPYIRKLFHLKNINPFKLKGEDYLKSNWKRAFDVTVAFPAILFALPILFKRGYLK